MSLVALFRLNTIGDFDHPKHFNLSPGLKSFLLSIWINYHFFILSSPLMSMICRFALLLLSHKSHKLSLFLLILFYFHSTLTMYFQRACLWAHCFFCLISSLLMPSIGFSMCSMNFPAPWFPFDFFPLFWFICWISLVDFWIVFLLSQCSQVLLKTAILNSLPARSFICMSLRSVAGTLLFPFGEATFLSYY